MTRLANVWIPQIKRKNKRLLNEAHAYWLARRSRRLESRPRYLAGSLRRFAADFHTTFTFTVTQTWERGLKANVATPPSKPAVRMTAISAATEILAFFALVPHQSD
jgi:hypothetical protein